MILHTYIRIEFQMIMNILFTITNSNNIQIIILKKMLWKKT
jgi:hypothetical protein